MKSIAIAAVFACVLMDLAVAEFQKCNFKERDFMTEITARKSDNGDDAISVARCERDESLVACYCDPLHGDGSCDGTYIELDQIGYRCVAVNGAFGNSVRAQALCQKNVIMCESSYTNHPSIICPQNYKVLSCTEHSDYLHTYEKAAHVVQRDNGCFSGPSCLNCKVQAICTREYKN